MTKRTQVTWGGRFSERPAHLMQDFSESISFDSRLAPYDIACSLAHAEMLKTVGLMTAKDFKSIQRGLKAIAKEIAKGEFQWDPGLEDVHMNIEQALTARVPAATRLHTGRSRNDQVATDMRLFFKAACAELEKSLLGVQSALLGQVERTFGLKISIPGYTHLQRAQPVPAAHHLLAWMEMFQRDLERIRAVAERANSCPLGSGALAGSTLPLDRKLTAVLLGFVDQRGKPRVTENSMDAVADRDVFLEFTYATNLCALHLSRIAEDMILWSSAEFSFIQLPDAFSTGSSLMPQKKNPDSLELIRGKAGRIVGGSHQLELMVKGLPLTYNRDLQEDKPAVFDAYEQTLSCLNVLAALVPGISWNEASCRVAVSDPLLLVTDLVDWLVERGLPFRDAHHVVGHLVKAAEDAELLVSDLPDEVAKAIHPELNGPWREVFDLNRAFQRRNGVGMPGWNPIRQKIKAWKKLL